MFQNRISDHSMGAVHVPLIERNGSPREIFPACYNHSTSFCAPPRLRSGDGDRRGDKLRSLSSVGMDELRWANLLEWIKFSIYGMCRCVRMGVGAAVFGATVFGVAVFGVAVFGAAVFGAATSAGAQTFMRSDLTNFSQDPTVFAWNIERTTDAGVTDLSATLRVPAGGDGFVRSRGAAFETDAGPIKFWATNLCFGGNFPNHDKADAVAAKLARFGVSCVRLHHMDMRDIWGKSENKRKIDPDQLEKLDYLISQLKKRGIYTNINLHVSRTLGEAEGFPNSGDGSIPSFDKGLDNFEPRMIEAQKEYARDLLTHVNPYTGNAYTNEPAIAFVEINNENSLTCQWGWGEMDHLPEPYASEFQKRWNAFLVKKYRTDSAIRNAWNCRNIPLGTEILKCTDFSKDWEKYWNIERDSVTKATVETGRFGPDQRNAIRISIEKMGAVAWNPQIHHATLTLSTEQPYTFSFAIRSDTKKTLNVNCRQNVDPWAELGLSRTIEVGPEWKTYHFTFEIPTNESNARVGFSGFSEGVFEFADLSLRTGGQIGLKEQETLNAETIPILEKNALNLPIQARHDWIDFLRETEEYYWNEMYEFLKNDLQVQSLVTGTQMRWSTAAMLSKMDFIDAHDYWNHPEFPGTPWDGKNWYVSDEPLVNHPEGSVARLAATRVLGSPYTISEYNEPQPITWAPEGFILISAYGALQDWNAIYSFAWRHGNDFDSGMIASFFDIESDAARLVHFPACVHAFVRGDIQNAKTICAGEMSREIEQKLHRESLQPFGINTQKVGIPSEQALIHAIGLESIPNEERLREGTAFEQWIRVTSEQPMTIPQGTSVYQSDTDELCWDVTQKDAGFFTASSPKTKMVTGFIRGRTATLDDVSIEIGKTRSDWATITLTTMDGADMTRESLRNTKEPTTILLAATGEQQNTEMKLRQEGTRVTCGDQWGRSPILCEGVTANVRLPVETRRVSVRPLDGAGRPTGRIVPLQGQNADADAMIPIGPEFRTLWYVIEISPDAR